MSGQSDRQWSRRRLLQAGALLGGAVALQPPVSAAAAATLLGKPIPATGERLPLIGIGTNAFRNADYPTLREVLKRLHELGGTVIDTAPLYGDSEALIGRALAELQLRDRMFLSTKFNAVGKGFGSMDRVFGRESFLRSMELLGGKSIDLLEVHRPGGLDELLPVMQDYKQAGRIRYLGVTTYVNQEHAAIADALRRHTLDFIQIDYSLGNRSAAERVLPLAAERKVAVMVNVPLGGRRGSLLQEVGSRSLPAWAADFGASTWSQFFLKYVVSHPAVTCAIPGTTKIAHLEDNLGAARGRLPSAAERKRMEDFWDGKTG